MNSTVNRQEIRMVDQLDRGVRVTDLRPHANRMVAALLLRFEPIERRKLIGALLVALHHEAVRLDPNWAAAKFGGLAGKVPVPTSGSLKFEGRTR